LKKSIQKPSNWQDFESLCKKLWCEIWNCDSIKKNGRTGQNQHGIDVYGIPKNETMYYGIQCKGKDDYTKSKLSKKEIDNEIIKAKNFKPSLRKFIFATTANKDAKIEEYIREVNVKHIAQGLFVIDIYSWEDIADLIEENRNTYNWYIKRIDFKMNQSVDILFHNEQNNCVITPTFNRSNITIKSDHIPRSQSEIIATFLDRSSFSIPKKVENISFSKVGIVISNSGNIAFEEIKLKLEIENNFQSVKETNIENVYISLVTNNVYWIDENIITYRPLPTNRILVPKDHKYFEFFLKPHPRKYKLSVKWTFLSKDFNCSGKNIIRVNPIFKETKITRSPQNNEKNGETFNRTNDAKIELIDN